MTKLNGMDVVPAPWATRPETRRVRGGHLNRWSLRAEVRVPCVNIDPEMGKIFAHPSLIDKLMASGAGKRIYLLGPSDPADALYGTYATEADRLRGLGHFVVSPAEIDEPATATGHTRRALAQMLACDTVALLPGWPNSKISRWLAADLGMTVVYARELQA